MKGHRNRRSDDRVLMNPSGLLRKKRFGVELGHVWLARQCLKLDERLRQHQPVAADPHFSRHLDELPLPAVALRR